jgi:Ca2+-binding EF-hand superfamily protein
MNIANKYSKQKIDLKTFKAMISEIYQLFSNDEIEAIFNHLDSNKKGMI